MHHILQNLAPQKALTAFAGWVATCRCPKVKNWIIRRFIRKFNVNMQEAISQNIEDYPDFNSFFTRYLKPELRPITQDTHQVASPADGIISQLGYIQDDSLLQAKGFNFNLATLLGNSAYTGQFNNGAFVTIYLSPKDYHRVHMPLEGKLRETTYIPGKLFSVSQLTTRTIPNLFSRNERLVCIFDTQAGPMAVILVGAMLVGSINTVWDTQIASSTITSHTYEDGLELARGAELGHFQMGSTVIVLFAKDKIKWSAHLNEDSNILMGQAIATIV